MKATKNDNNDKDEDKNTVQPVPYARMHPTAVFTNLSSASSFITAWWGSTSLRMELCSGSTTVAPLYKKKGKKNACKKRIE